MKHLKALAMATILAAFSSTSVPAQVTLDVAKITCKQLRGYEITNPNNIAIWLSGYYHGKKGSTVLQVDEFKNAADKVSEYCISNPTATVMQAVEAISTASPR